TASLNNRFRALIDAACAGTADTKATPTTTTQAANRLKMRCFTDPPYLTAPRVDRRAVFLISPIALLNRYRWRSLHWAGKVPARKRDGLLERSVSAGAHRPQLWSPVSPPPASSTARSRQGILKPGSESERIGAHKRVGSSPETRGRGGDRRGRLRSPRSAALTH